MRIELLSARSDFTPQTLRDAAFDPYLTAFARLIPALVAAWDALPAGRPQKARLAGPVGLLRGWDYRWGADSMPTSLAVFWGEALWPRWPRRERGLVDLRLHGRSRYRRAAARGARAASDRLTQDFGSWQVPWGEINRFQRNDGAIVQPFDDAKPSIPVPFTSAQWGSLASFGAKRYPGTKRYYGTSGNSFVAVVEFGRSARLGGDGRRRERPSRLAALQRPGRTLRERQPAPRLFLSRRAQGTHRAQLPAGPAGTSQPVRRPPAQPLNSGLIVLTRGHDRPSCDAKRAPPG